MILPIPFDRSVYSSLLIRAHHIKEISTFFFTIACLSADICRKTDERTHSLRTHSTCMHMHMHTRTSTHTHTRTHANTHTHTKQISSNKRFLYQCVSLRWHLPKDYTTAQTRRAQAWQATHSLRKHFHMHTRTRTPRSSKKRFLESLCWFTERLHNSPNQSWPELPFTANALPHACTHTHTHTHTHARTQKNKRFLYQCVPLRWHLPKDYTIAQTNRAQVWRAHPFAPYAIDQLAASVDASRLCFPRSPPVKSCQCFVFEQWLV